jgi:DNA processing protein
MQPRENQGLAEQILAPGGNLISEFVIPTPPTPQNFSNSESHSYCRIASSAEFPWTCQLFEATEYSGTLMRQAAQRVASRKAFGNNYMQTPGSSATRPPLNLPLGRPHLCLRAPSCRRMRKKVLAMLKADKSMRMDGVVEGLENEVSPSEIFAARFELELGAKIKQFPGKNFVKAF